MIPSVLPTYSRAPLTFTSGEGSWLVEADGRRFLDLGAGIAVELWHRKLRTCGQNGAQILV